MAIRSYEELQNKIYDIDKDELYKRICRNIKDIRLKKYKEFKKLCTNNKINPYSTENIADLINYSHTHYKRFESDNDKTKKIPLPKLILLSLILDTTLDEIVKEDNK